MRVGTKSVLFGAHAFWLHPWFVAWGWWRLYGFPWDPRLWVAFFVHDLGYWGCPNMDGEEGELHPLLGALWMWKLTKSAEWYQLVKAHSRFLAKAMQMEPSRLCWADKLAFALTPWWLYLPMVRLTGEIREYKAVEKHRADSGWQSQGTSWADDRAWHSNLRARVLQVVYDSR